MNAWRYAAGDRPPPRSSSTAADTSLEKELTVTKPLTHKQALAAVIQALGGTWDPPRAALALRLAGYEPATSQAGEKEGRRILRELTEEGTIVRPDPERTEYHLPGI